MRDANNLDETVRARLRVVLARSVVVDADDQAGVRGQPPPQPQPPPRPQPQSPPPPVASGRDDDGWPPFDEVPLSPADRSVARGDGVRDPGLRTGDLPSGDARPGSGDGAEPGRLSGIGAFDPGRRGVKSLVAVAAVVVLIAGVLAWRARPQVEPVPPVPAAEAAGTEPPPIPGMTNPAAGGGPAGGGTAAAGTVAAGEVVVAVGGKVRTPGLVRLPPGSRVADALKAAGGADQGVDVALLNLARKVVDGELILVGVTPPPGMAVPTGGAGAPAGGAAAPAGGPVNLNTATLADLDTLPGVGPVLAQRILDHREQQGGFKAVSDLRKVDGIGSSRYEQLKDLVTV